MSGVRNPGDVLFEKPTFPITQGTTMHEPTRCCMYHVRDLLIRLYELTGDLRSRAPAATPSASSTTSGAAVHAIEHNHDESQTDRLERERERWRYWLHREPNRWAVLDDDVAEELEDAARAADDAAVEKAVAVAVAALAARVDKLTAAVDAATATKQGDGE